MNVHSLGYRTDLIFSRFGGEVFDRGDYLVVRTPSNPPFIGATSSFLTGLPATATTHDGERSLRRR